MFVLRGNADAGIRSSTVQDVLNTQRRRDHHRAPGLAHPVPGRRAAIETVCAGVEVKARPPTPST